MALRARPSAGWDEWALAPPGRKMVSGKWCQLALEQSCGVGRGAQRRGPPSRGWWASSLRSSAHPTGTPRRYTGFSTEQTDAILPHFGCFLELQPAECDGQVHQLVG